MPSQFKRKQLLVNKAIQLAILRRVLVYWLFCVLFISVPLVLVHMLSNGHLSFVEQLSQCWSKYWLMYTLTLLLLPLAALDALRISNGFVGPVMRLKGELERYADHPELEFSGLRDTDFWEQLTGEVKRIDDQLETSSFPQDA